MNRKAAEARMREIVDGNIRGDGHCIEVSREDLYALGRDILIGVATTEPAVGVAHPTTPRALTTDEIRARFLSYVRSTIDYWHDVQNLDGSVKTLRDRLEGVAFSILVAIDGEAMAVPGFKLIPDPHPDDKQYHITNGENWYPDDVDIAGGLHSQLLNP